MSASHSEPQTGSITLEPMVQQGLARGPDEDWTGVSCPVERRRLQNRINQRARRKRQALNAHANALVASQAASTPPPHQKPTPSCSAAWATGEEELQLMLPQGVERITSVRRDKLPRILGQVNEWYTRKNLLYPPDAQRLWLGDPNAERLLTFVRFNMMRALVLNYEYLGMSLEDALDDDAISSFYVGVGPGGGSGGRGGDSGEHSYDHLPPTMRPTRLQREVPHHPWIDTIPVPGMRDNILRSSERFDVVEDELCHDLAGFVLSTPPPRVPSSGEEAGEEEPEPAPLRDGIMVWAESWDPMGWELTESFALRWGWVLRGCTEVFDSTNYWRAKRGEKPFPFQTSKNS